MLMATAPGLHSPMPILHLAGPNSTPVSEAMDAAAWLRAATTDVTEEVWGRTGRL